MAEIYTPRASYGTAFAVNRFFAKLGDFTNGIQARRAEALTRKALSSLSDHELRDIGLTRGEIDSIARAQFIR